jgi:hypothetical protein
MIKQSHAEPSPLSIPPYSSPVEQHVRCLCRKYYVVCVASALISAEASRVIERRANAMGATFVDSRLTPWLGCECGQLLDFTPEGSALVM